MKLFITGTVVAMIAVASSALQVDTSKYEKLDIQVACQGIDYDNVSPSALAFSAEALEETFKMAHEEGEALDGLELFYVSSTVPLIRSNNLRGKEFLSFIAKIPMEANENGSDDFKCRLCGSDVATAKLLEAHKLQLWEASFASFISISPFDSLKNVDQCNIKLSSYETDLEPMPSFAVDVNVQCENMNFAEMPIQMVAYVSKSLKESFDIIHSAIDGSKIKSMVLAQHRLLAGDVADNDDFHCRWCSCRLCGSDELESTDSVAFTAYVLTPASMGADDFQCRLCENLPNASDQEALIAWKHIFNSRLLKDPQGRFNDAKHCSISMKEKENAQMA